MIYITRQRNVRTQGITGIFGSIELTDKDGKTLSLFTRERPWLYAEQWPFGKPMDSCVKSGEYALVRGPVIKFNREEFFIYNERLGVKLYSGDLDSAIERYGCIFITSSPLDQPEGCIQLGLRLVHKDGDYQLSNSVEAHRLFRTWLDNNPDQRTIKIGWEA